MRYNATFLFANKFIDKFMKAGDFGDNKTYVSKVLPINFEYKGNTDNILKDLLKVKNKLNEQKDYEVVYLYLENDPQYLGWKKE